MRYGATAVSCRGIPECFHGFLVSERMHSSATLGVNDSCASAVHDTGRTPTTLWLFLFPFFAR